jgi:hypothetical protein
MHYVVLATDYDGTLAADSRVDAATVSALEDLRQGGRRIILVTGRELDDLKRVMPRLDLFDRIVAENGALLFQPATGEERCLADPPPPRFVARLNEMGVAPLSVGRVIVATWEPNEGKVLEAIKDLGLELHIVFNKGAVMVLPAGVSKESGLRVALEELNIARLNSVGVGDAENDFAFLDLCGLPVAVANAIPSLREHAVLVTEGERGAGVVELARRMLATDLAECDAGNPRQQVALAAPLPDDPSDAITFAPPRACMLLVGVSGGGKSTLTLGLVERVADAGMQFCVIDPEGDYAEVQGAICIGTAQEPPRVEAVLDVLGKTDTSAVVNLLGVQLHDRPAFLAELLPELMMLRRRVGRPHFIVVDEAHHMLPATTAGEIADSDLAGMMFITTRPGALAERVLRAVDRIIAVGDAPEESLRHFCEVRELPIPADSVELVKGEMLTLSVDAPAPRHMRVIPGKGQQRRHIRKYAEGALHEDKCFYFRGPGARLNLRAQNLISFIQIGEGVDRETWEFHRGRGDYSRWIGLAIKDRELTREIEQLERSDQPTDEARRALRAAIEARYTLPS